MSTIMSISCNNRKEFLMLCKADNEAFLKANRGRYYMEYVRYSSDGISTGKGDPNAVLIALKRDNGTLALGWSSAYTGLYDEDGRMIRRPEQFNKRIGLWKAIRRATEQGRLNTKIPNRLVSTSNWLGNPQESIVSQFMERAAAELGVNY